MNTDTLKHLESSVALSGSNKPPIQIYIEKDGKEEILEGHIIRVENNRFIFYPTNNPASEATLRPPLYDTKVFRVDQPTLDGYQFKCIKDVA